MLKIKHFVILSSALLLICLQGCRFNSMDTENDVIDSKDETAAGVRLQEFFTALGDVDYNITGSVNITNDEIYSRWAQTGNALMPDTHGDVIKICYVDSQGNGVNSSLKLYDICPETDSYLVFDYKCSLYTFEETVKPYSSENCVLLYVDDVKQGQTYGSMGNTIWRSTGIKLTAGENHTVEWKLPWLKYYSKSLKNCIYLDNLRLVPVNDYEQVHISPMGKQETLVNNPIFFTASTEWTGSAPVFSVSEGASITSNGRFTASKPGTYTVTVTIDGKSASNTSVIVHDKDYFASPVTTAGKTFKGFLESTTEEPFFNPYPDGLIINDLSPKTATFNADGFFILSGTVTDPQSQYCVYVRKKISDDSDKYYTTLYPVSGDFTQRIWLRFGDGIYEVYLCIQRNDMIYWHSISYIVTCISNMTAQQAMYTMPSAIVNSDSFEVSNAVNDALYYYPDADTGAKLQLIHDWIMHHFHYDYISMDPGRRKSQYSDFCINSGMAVCEGYADTFAAMARYCNIPCSVIFTSSEDMNHAWNEVYYKDEWKLVDVTWDDTYYDPDHSDFNTDKHPYEENYSYFLIDKTGIENDHVDKYWQGPMERHLEKEDVIPPHHPDLPDGWY